jgi:predicted regulator of Ras-like GTPase activity (Roadblock/LC7/MglB family)
MLGNVDAAAALAELTDISPQIRRVVVVGADGAVVGSNAPDRDSAGRLAERGLRLATEADALRGEHVSQLEAATGEGSVFVVRDDGRTIIATTRAEPTVGLVFYDLKTALRSIDVPFQDDTDGGGGEAHATS